MKPSEEIYEKVSMKRSIFHPVTDHWDWIHSIIEHLDEQSEKEQASEEKHCTCDANDDDSPEHGVLCDIAKPQEASEERIAVDGCEHVPKGLKAYCTACLSKVISAAKPQEEPKETKCCGKCVRISREDDGSVDEKWCNDKDCQCHQESETGNTTVNTAILGSDCVCLKWNPEANFTHTGPCLCGQPVFVGRCALEGIHYCNERGGKTSHTKPQDEPKEESAIGDLILDFQFNNGLQVGNSIIHMIGHSKDGSCDNWDNGCPCPCHKESESKKGKTI